MGFLVSNLFLLGSGYAGLGLFSFRPLGNREYDFLGGQMEWENGMGFRPLKLDYDIIHQHILAGLVEFASAPWGNELVGGDVRLDQGFPDGFRRSGAGAINGIAKNHEPHETASRGSREISFRTGLEELIDFLEHGFMGG